MSYDGAQMHGLNPRAGLFLQTLGEDTTMESSGEYYEDALGNRIVLDRYVFESGRLFCERVQDNTHRYDSGEHVFTALQDERGEWVPETRWTDAEMKKIEDENW